MKIIEIVYRIDHIDSTASKFLNLTSGFSVFAFSGELGAGKTTLISAICKKLGVGEVVSSPTFSIIQQYTCKNGNPVFHMDLYRIKDEEEAIHSGLEDCIISGDICLIEWPENAPGILPQKTVKTQIEIRSKEERKLILQIPE